VKTASREIEEGSSGAEAPRPPSFRFEKLEVWQRSVELAEVVYRHSGRFPSEERYGLTSQIRRAAVSVGANIAEGSGRPSHRDFAHFLDQAYGSCMEVVSLAEVAFRLSYLGGADRAEVRSVAASVAAMTSALRRSLLAGES
jgi:four helix bundle protein